MTLFLFLGEMLPWSRGRRVEKRERGERSERTKITALAKIFQGAFESYAVEHLAGSLAKLRYHARECAWKCAWETFESRFLWAMSDSWITIAI